MTVYGGPDIVTDGLVLHLDAANRKSYPGSGNTWYDLSGNGNHATNTGLYFNDDGKSFQIYQTGDISEVDSTNLQPAEITVEILFYLISLGDGWLFSCQTSNFYNYNNGYLFRYDNPTFHLYWSTGRGSTFTRITKTGFLENGKWHHIVGTCNASQQALYSNGNVQTTSGGSIDYTGVRDVITIGAYNAAGTGRTLSNIGFIKVYNRALSAYEVRQNYNALKGRYGL